MALAPGSWPAPLLKAVRMSNKHLLNPVMVRLAGRKRWYAAAIEHTGRRSGKRYTTPVVADPIEDGLLIPLPYGTQVDWLQNVLAAGKATVTVDGDKHEVVEPEIIGADAALPLLAAGRQRMFGRVGIDHYLKVRCAPATG
jgi:deazaflavin-dependent oxidoreductase (nitroreductase family)